MELNGGQRRSVEVILGQWRSMEVNRGQWNLTALANVRLFIVQVSMEKGSLSSIIISPESHVVRSINHQRCQEAIKSNWLFTSFRCSNQSSDLVHRCFIVQFGDVASVSTVRAFFNLDFWLLKWNENVSQWRTMEVNWGQMRSMKVSGQWRSKEVNGGQMMSNIVKLCQWRLMEVKWGQ